MKMNNHKEIIITCRRTAQSCMKYLRQKAIQVINKISIRNIDLYYI